MSDLSAAIADLERLDAGTLGIDAFCVWSSPAAEPGVFQVSFPSYTARLGTVWDALRGAGYDPVAKLDYIAWVRRFDGTPDSVQAIARMTASDLAHLVVRLHRGERFADGSWQDVLKRGVLLAVLRRAQVLAADGKNPARG